MSIIKCGLSGFRARVDEAQYDQQSSMGHPPHADQDNTNWLKNILGAQAPDYEVLVATHTQWLHENFHAIKNMNRYELAAVLQCLNKFRVTSLSEILNAREYKKILVLNRLLSEYAQWAHNNSSEIEFIGEFEIQGLLAVLSQSSMESFSEIKCAPDYLRAVEVARLIDKYPDFSSRYADVLKTFDKKAFSSLTILLINHYEWMKNNFDLIKQAGVNFFDGLNRLLFKQKDWVTKNISHLVKMNEIDQLNGVFYLVRQDAQWTESILPKIVNMEFKRLFRLRMLLGKKEDWVKRNFEKISLMSYYQMLELGNLLDLDENWCADNLSFLVLMKDHVPSEGLGTLFKKHPTWTKENFSKLVILDEQWVSENIEELKKLGNYEITRIADLLKNHSSWLKQNFENIKQMEGGGLGSLNFLLNNHQDWVTQNLEFIIDKRESFLKGLGSLLDTHGSWVNDNLTYLAAACSGIYDSCLSNLESLVPLLDTNEKWVSQNLRGLFLLNERQIKCVAPLLVRDASWLANNLQRIGSLTNSQVDYIADLILMAPDWTKSNFRELMRLNSMVLQALPEIVEHNISSLEKVNLSELSKSSIELADQGKKRKYLSRLIDSAYNGFYSSVNGFVSDELKPESVMSESVLKSYGASRSTLEPSSDEAIRSCLSDKFAVFYEMIPDATFGVEVEGFMPGLKPENDFNRIRRKMKTEKYAYEEDETLDTNSNFATPVEMVTNIKKSPNDIRELHSNLCRLNDWGYFTNSTAGLHIHTGVKQWKTHHCLSSDDAESAPANLEEWDNPSEVRPNLSPFQMLFLKQFVINMVSIEKEFYMISRLSDHSRPNGSSRFESNDELYRKVAVAKTFGPLKDAVNPDGRDYNININAVEIHGTVEIRGFTNKNSDHMEVDPNITIRNIVFLQQVLIKTLKNDNIRNHLLSGRSIDDPVDLRPSEGLNEIVDNYVQHIFFLQIIHAVAQRQTGKAIKTMEMILQDEKYIKPETIALVKAHVSKLPLHEAEQCFINALNGEESRLPAEFMKDRPNLTRSVSLRSMADHPEIPY